MKNYKFLLKNVDKLLAGLVEEGVLMAKSEFRMKSAFVGGDS
jgi:hypothetical protein